MAITIPILTDFNGSGIEKATRKFKELEGVGAKAHHALRLAAIPAAAALGAVGVAAVDAVKSAAEDEAAQVKLAGALKRTTGASQAALAATEDFITKMSMERAISDDELRPALATLARGTNDLAEAQKGLGLATDIAAATGKPLESVATALSKAYAGQYTALGKLDPSMKALIKSGAGTDEIFAKLEKRFGGSAAESAQTAQGRMKGLGIAIDETKESIGAALLPALQAVLPVLQQFGQWAQQHPGVFLALAGAIVGVAVAIGIANVAMTLMAMNPVALTVMAVVAAVALLTVGLITLWKRSETFREIVTGAWDAVQSAVQVFVDYVRGPVMAMWDTLKGAFDLIAGILTGDFSRAWDGLKGMIGGVVEWIKTTLLALPITIAQAALAIGTSIVTGIGSGIVNLAETVWGKITEMPGALLKLAGQWLGGLQEIGGKVIDWIVSGVSGLAAAIWDKISGFASALASNVAEGAKDAIVGIGEKIVDWIVSGVTGVASGITKAVKAAINLGIDALNAGISGLNKGVGLINAIIPGGDPVPEIPKIPHLAAGGIVTRPTFALIGEAGPEAVIPLNRRSNAMGNLTINVQAGLVSSPDQIGQQIIEAIQSAQRRSGPVFAAA